jgi:hypothetical protein
LFRKFLVAVRKMAEQRPAAKIMNMHCSKFWNYDIINDGSQRCL